MRGKRGKTFPHISWKYDFQATDEIQTIFHATICLCRGVLVNDH